MLGLNLSLGLASSSQGRNAVSRMVAALRRLGGSLWMVDNAFSGAFVDNVGTTPVTAVGDLIGKVLDKAGTNHATQSDVASKPSVQQVPKRLGPNLVTTSGATLAGGTGFTAITGGACAATKSYAWEYTCTLTSGTVQGVIGGTLLSSTSTSGAYRGVAVAANSTAPQFYSAAGVGSVNGFIVQEVLEWANVISFDGSNDFLTTGITTGNEGWMAAGVTFADANVTFFSSGTTAANAGVWLYRNVGGAKSMNLAVANGSAIAYSPNIISPTNTPVVVSGGWTATTVFAGVDHTETSTSSRSGASASALPLRLGIATDASYPLNGLKHAAAYAPVLPDAATRKVIINGLAALQGRTL